MFGFNLFLAVVSTKIQPRQVLILPWLNWLIGSGLKLSPSLGYSLKNKPGIKNPQFVKVDLNTQLEKAQKFSRDGAIDNRDITAVLTYRAWQRPVSWSEQCDRAALEIIWNKNANRNL